MADIVVSEFPFFNLIDNQLRELMYDNVWSKVFSSQRCYSPDGRVNPSEIGYSPTVPWPN